MLLTLVGAVLSGMVGMNRQLDAADRKPNIVLIVADDLGYAEMSCQGSTDIRTPHLDAMARGGVRCTSAYVTAPVCCPSRAGLMTGRYQTRFGHELNAIGAQNKEPGVGLPLSERTFADRMRAAGYATGMVGKWHLGGTAPFHPERRGFDQFYGFLHEGHFFLPPPYRGGTTRLRDNEPPYDEDNSVLRGETAIVEPEYLTDALTREALAYIDAHRDEPFFLYLPYNAVHSPMQATHKYMERFPDVVDEHRRVFAAMLSALDDGVGAVMGKIREAGLEEDTLVFFLSDNGGPTAELTSSNLPLTGGKGQLYEGGTRIPFLVAWKGQLPAGRIYDEPITSLDLLPTALAAAGEQPPVAPEVDGVNLLPYLSGDGAGTPHDVLYWRYGPQGALREGNWKYLQLGRGGAAQLFDLSRDLGEQHDMAAERPEILSRLEKAWQAWNTEQVEPLWGRRRGRR